MRLKKLLLVPFVLITVTATAQPVMTGANFNPVAGDVFAYGQQPVPASWSNSGANVTWDFSLADSASNGAQSPWKSCSVQNDCSQFPGSNIVYNNNDFGDWQYYDNDADKRRYMGNLITGIYDAYTDGKDVMRYPMTYQSTYTDSFGGPVNHYGTFLYTEKGSITVTADAYGTMITPAATYSNTLRVHMMENYVDSFNSSYVTPYNNDSYLWLVPGIHDAVFKIVNGAAYYTTVEATAVPNLSLSESSLKVYPNPATTAVNVDFVTEVAATVSITLMDVTGRTTAILANGTAAAGQQHYSYPTTGLPRGIYYLRLQTGSTNVTRKVEVL